MEEQARTYWLEILERLARPALKNLSRGSLQLNLPVQGERAKYATLEIAGRILAGIAPWLETPTDGEEEVLRKELAALARQGLAVGTNLQSQDSFNFSDGDQPLVDAAFLAQAILRAPTELWDKLEKPTQARLVAGLRSTRQIPPYFCNWLLFSAMIEAALFSMGEMYDPVRVDYALRQMEQWHLGDGMYSDGPQFHWDYYNSFVIQPMLLDIIKTFSPQNPDVANQRPIVLERSQRHAVILERMISPDGTFPPLGRSLAYRFGAFQLLAQLALGDELSPELSPAQVRCALTAVIKRTMDAPNTFDDQGWLRVGLSGYQPALGEPYISVASTYLCSTGLLPLGLPKTHPFWSDPAEPFTSQKIWRGDNVAADQALE